MGNFTGFPNRRGYSALACGFTPLRNQQFCRLSYWALFTPQELWRGLNRSHPMLVPIKFVLSRILNRHSSRSFFQVENLIEGIIGCRLRHFSDLNDPADDVC
jgi:hypothetical protein